MQATLSFNLPEESTEHLDALEGRDWKTVVYELNEQLRTYQKHGHSFKTADDLLEELRTILRSLIEDRRLSLE
jgi:predicted DNA-binding protein